MAIIDFNSISGINSITAQSNALNFFNATGSTLSIGASVSGNLTGNVTGNVNSTGISTFSGGLSIGTGASISSPATNVLTLGTNNVESVRINSSGNIGIGTQSPSEKLDVGGSISAAGRNLNVPHIIVKDSNGRVTYFEYYFNLVKLTNAGTATQLNILSVGNLSNFHQAAFTVEYGTRIQGVSDATVSACLKQFGVNKFNGGNVAITDTNDIASDTNSNTHANITCVTNGASAYIIRGEFSSTVANSSFISGVLRGWGVADVFNSGGVATLTFSNGPT